MIGLNEHIKHFLRIKAIVFMSFVNWKNISGIDDKVSNLKTKIIPRKVNSTFGIYDVMV